MSPKVDRWISISSVIAILAVPAMGCFLHMTTTITAQAGEIENVRTMEADHYGEIISRLRRIEDKIDQASHP